MLACDGNKHCVELLTMIRKRPRGTVIDGHLHKGFSNLTALTWATGPLDSRRAGTGVDRTPLRIEFGCGLGVTVACLGPLDSCRCTGAGPHCFGPLDSRRCTGPLDLCRLLCKLGAPAVPTLVRDLPPSHWQYQTHLGR